VETFDGSAWVAVVPFLIQDLRPPLLPPIPWLSTFPETNCRTYVRAPDGSSGVWFFSLDAARAAAVAGARLTYRLPYVWSRMSVEATEREVRYRSERLWRRSNATTVIGVRFGEPIPQHDLEIFLTARFKLYSFLLGRVAYANVEHPPWPLHSAEVISLEESLVEAAGLPQPEGQPLVYYSPSIFVRVSRLRWL
jgi:uncharacterized protein YqjF (DUF2071 family)